MLEPGCWDQKARTRMWGPGCKGGCWQWDAGSGMQAVLVQHQGCCRLCLPGGASLVTSAQSPPALPALLPLAASLSSFSLCCAYLPLAPVPGVPDPKAAQNLLPLCFRAGRGHAACIPLPGTQQGPTLRGHTRTFLLGRATDEAQTGKGP